MPDQVSPLTDERQLQGHRLEGAVRARWKDPRGIRGLSEDLGVSRATLYSWFRGQSSPDTASLSRLARLLRVYPSELLTDLQGGDQSALTDERIRAVVDETVEERMLGRAPLSWREPPPALAMRAESAQLRATAMPSTAGRAIIEPRRARSPRVLDVLGPQKVEWCNADDTIGPVARRLYEANYSQMPVRDRDAWIGLLTTDTIARWTAARTTRGLTFDESTPVREVLPYAEDPENLRLVSDGATPNDVLRLIEDMEARGHAIPAVVVTAGSERTGEPLGIVTAFDLARLRASMGSV